LPIMGTFEIDTINYQYAMMGSGGLILLLVFIHVPCAAI